MRSLNSVKLGYMTNEPVVPSHVFLALLAKTNKRKHEILLSLVTGSGTDLEFPGFALFSYRRCEETVAPPDVAELQSHQPQ